MLQGVTATAVTPEAAGRSPCSSPCRCGPAASVHDTAVRGRDGGQSSAAPNPRPAARPGRGRTRWACQGRGARTESWTWWREGGSGSTRSRIRGAPTSAHHYPLNKHLRPNRRHGSEGHVEPCPLSFCAVGRQVVTNEAHKGKVRRPRLTEEKPGVRACVVCAGCRPPSTSSLPFGRPARSPSVRARLPQPRCWPVGAQHPLVRGSPFQPSAAVPGRKDSQLGPLPRMPGKLLSTSCQSWAARTCSYGQPRSSAPGESSCSPTRAGRPRGALLARLSVWLCLTPVLPPVPTYGSSEFPFSFKLLWVVVL